MAGTTIRVLVVDDSALVRRTVARLIEEDPGLRVVGTASDGAEALERTDLLHPDVVTLDISMPVMDGIACLGELIRKHRQRVVVLSTLAGETTFTTYKALALGAVDFVTKPGTESHLTTPEELGRELRAKVRAAAGVSAGRIGRRPAAEAAGAPGARAGTAPLRDAPPRPAPRGLVGLGGSTGGAAALEELLTCLPADLPAGLVVVQHLPAGFSAGFARYLSTATPFEVVEAREGDPVLPGRVAVAPGDAHLRVQRTAGGTVLRLDRDGPKVNGYRPSIDTLLYSIAVAERERAVGVLLSGMGDDGVNGLGAVRRLSGRTFVQDRGSSIVFGMAERALALGCADEPLPPDRLADALVRAVAGPSGFGPRKENPSVLVA